LGDRNEYIRQTDQVRRDTSWRAVINNRDGKPGGFFLRNGGMADDATDQCSIAAHDHERHVAAEVEDTAIICVAVVLAERALRTEMSAQCERRTLSRPIRKAEPTVASSDGETKRVVGAGGHRLS